MPVEDVSKSIINVLDEHTANRIAAGEVVERPASVVKELVENSIDAGATQITIVLEDGGKTLIKITDNGSGMTREDAVLSIQRHATSKIRDAQDLDSILTLGFRGEALPSIASVSVMEIVTKHESDPTGVSMRIEAGTVTDMKSVGVAQGTSISIKNLFFNTPARMKFLKSTQTELSHITEMIGWFAVAYSNIYFRLIHGSKEIITSPASNSRLNSIACVYGKDTAKKMVEIGIEYLGVKVYGFIAIPSLSKSNRSDQVFFVNGRPIKNKSISHAVDFSYKGLLQPGRYAVAIIFIEVDPEIVDVNVHPSKAEVKFSNERDVHSAVHRAVNQALLQGAAIPSITDISSQQRQTNREYESYPVRQNVLISDFEGDVEAFRDALAKRREELTGQYTTPNDPFVWKKGAGVPMEESPVPEADFEASRTVALSGIKVIGQARNLYIVCQCDDGILIFDQHVVHERILYDAMIKLETQKDAYVQMLIIPANISLSAKEATIVKHKLEDIKKAGFILEEFGNNDFMLRGVPASVKQEKSESILREMISELVDISIARHLVVKSDQVLITASCKLAVKAGDSLSIEEMNKLMEDLLKCENPFVCPHGRPIMLSLSNWELDRKFRRV